MSRIIKVRCNGAGRHVNEVDLDEVLREDVVLRGVPVREGLRFPKRLVLPCRLCTEGKVIVLREMIEENL